MAEQTSTQDRLRRARSNHPFRIQSRVLRSVLLGASIGWLAGCGAEERTYESSAVYDPPADRRVVVETVVEMPVEQAWDALVRRLSESPFRVTMLEKASRFVSVEIDRSTDLAAAANLPSRYIDCGKTTRTLEGEGRVRTFEYTVSESSEHAEAVAAEDHFRVSEVTRRVGLQARANIFLQSEGKRRTRVAINAKYQVDFEIAGSVKTVPRDAAEPMGPRVPFGPRRESIRFTTQRPGKDRRSGDLICRATGEFEHALIALANPAAAF